MARARLWMRITLQPSVYSVSTSMLNLNLDLDLGFDHWWAGRALQAFAIRANARSLMCATMHVKKYLIYSLAV